MEFHHYIGSITEVINKKYLIRVYLLDTSTRLTIPDILCSWYMLDIMYTCCDMHTIQFGYHVISSTIDNILVILTTIHWDNRIINWSNELSFTNYYVNIVRSKTIFTMVDTKKNFNKVWYFVELFLLNVISFLVVCWLEQTQYNTSTYTSLNISKGQQVVIGLLIL